MSHSIISKSFSAILITILALTIVPIQPARADTTVELAPTGDGTYTAWTNNWNEIGEGTTTAAWTGGGSGEGKASSTKKQRE